MISPSACAAGRRHRRRYGRSIEELPARRYFLMPPQMCIFGDISVYRTVRSLYRNALIQPALVSMRSVGISLLTAATLVLIAGLPATGQVSSDQSLPLRAYMTGPAEPATQPQESTTTEVHPSVVADVDSLPAEMPWIKQVFWGRNGVVRMLGLAPRHRSQEIEMRVNYLQRHQLFGLLTWGAMTVQVILGQMQYGDRARSSDGIGTAHRYLGYSTFGLYLATASQSILAPPARDYAGKSGTIRLHRWLAVGHFSGMIAQPLLGYRARQERLAGNLEAYQQTSNVHRWVGWGTYLTFTGALVSIFFPY